MSNPLHKHVRYVTKVGNRVVSLPTEPGSWELDPTDPASLWRRVHQHVSLYGVDTRLLDPDARPDPSRWFGTAVVQPDDDE